MPVSYDDVLKAAARLQNVAHRTRVVTSGTVDHLTGASVFFKDETEQRAGAFKFRGAYYALSSLSPEAQRRGVVAYSSGNHAQATARAGQMLGIPVTIVMPADAPAAKMQATRGYGATVITYVRGRDSREEIAAALAEKHGYTVIPPFDHPHIIAGQGTAAKEMIEDMGPLDRLFVCVGGGGLLAGSLLSAKALAPGCEVYGVEPEAGNDVQQSLKAGKPIHIAVPQTIADGAMTQEVGALTFPIIQQYVSGILTVTDDQLRDQVKFFWERMKMVVEPTGCLAAAAVQEKLLDNRGLRIGVIVSGGNVDVDRFKECLDRPARSYTATPV